MQATADIGALPAFYRAFLDSMLLVISNVPSAESIVNDDGRGVMKLEDVRRVVQMKDFAGQLCHSYLLFFPTPARDGCRACYLHGNNRPPTLRYFGPCQASCAQPHVRILERVYARGTCRSPRWLDVPGPQALDLPGRCKSATRAACRLSDHAGRRPQEFFARYPEITRAYLASINLPAPQALQIR